MKISVTTRIHAPLDRTWFAWTTPEHITQWNFASADWCCPSARLNLTPGGSFVYRMEAKDGSFGFDFDGTFTTVEPMKRIEFKMGDDRVVSVVFSETQGGEVVVEEVFDADDEFSPEQQQQGWQAILNNFKAHVEGLEPGGSALPSRQ